MTCLPSDTIFISLFLPQVFLIQFMFIFSSSALKIFIHTFDTFIKHMIEVFLSHFTHLVWPYFDFPIHTLIPHMTFFLISSAPQVINFIFRLCSFPLFILRSIKINDIIKSRGLNHISAIYRKKKVEKQKNLTTIF